MADGILKAKCCYYCKIILVAIEINLLLSVILMFDLFLTASVKTVLQIIDDKGKKYFKIKSIILGNMEILLFTFIFSLFNRNLVIVRGKSYG